jgi:hypothetical protein
MIKSKNRVNAWSYFPDMAYLLYALIGLTQILCIVHCIRNRCDYRWIYIVLFFPVIGGIVYLMMEVISPSGVQTSSQIITETVARKMMPSRKLEQLRQELQFSNTITNRENLADEYVLCGFFDEAITLYLECLEAANQNTAILLKLAKTYFEKNDFQNAEQALQKIISINPKYRPQVVKLLLARTYEGLEQIEPARSAYQNAINAHSDIEIKCFYALFLQKIGDLTKAREVFDQILFVSRRLPKHAQKLNRPWIQIANKVRKTL